MLVCALFLTGTAPSFAQKAGRAAAEKAVRAQLREPSSARFTEMSFRARPNARGEPTDVACGKVVARNGAGGMSAAVPFVLFLKSSDVKFAENGISIENDTIGIDAVVYSNFCLR